MNKPPKIILSFLRWFCDPELLPYIEGDLVDLYGEKVKKKGIVKAKWIFLLEVLKLLRPSLMRSFFRNLSISGLGVWGNYFKLAIRGLARNKLFSSLSIIGLALGIACTTGILFWVTNELQYNQFHSKKDRIHQVQLLLNGWENSVVTPAPLAPSLQSVYPEITNVTRFTYSEDDIIRIGDSKKVINKWTQADPSFYEMFDFAFIAGTPADFKENTMILTASTARYLYPNEPNPIGETVEIVDKGKYLIAAIIEDLPPHSSFQFDCMTAFPAKESYDPKEWGAWFCGTFIELHPDADPELLMAQTNNFKTFFESIGKPKWSTILVPLTDLYFETNMRPFFPKHGNIQYIWIFSIAGAVLFILTCLNYTSMATSKLLTRSKSIGLHRVLGANQGQLWKSYFAEGFVNVTLAIVIGTVVLMVVANQISLKPLPNNRMIALPFLLFTAYMMVITLIPVILFRKISPLSLIRPQVFSFSNNERSRRLLMTFQFGICIMMIICVQVLQNQLEFIQERDIGFDKSNILYLELNENTQQRVYELKQSLASFPEVVEISQSTFEQIYFDLRINDWEGKNIDQSLTMRPLDVDPSFLSVFGIRLIAGSFFRESQQTDHQLVINETAARAMGFNEPIGKKIKLPWDEQEWIVMGVVGDFNYRGLTEPIEPLLLFNDPAGDLYIRLSRNAPDSFAEKVQDTFHKINPEFSFEAVLLDRWFMDKHRDHFNTSQVFEYFSIVAIIIACISLFSMLIFVIERRSKEFGIRKVSGANALNIFLLLIKDFGQYLLVAILIMTPLSWWIVNRWLQLFVYRIELTFWPFVMSILFVTAAALLTVSFQSAKAARANPVNILRDE